jgi:hypothetical protein
VRTPYTFIAPLVAAVAAACALSAASAQAHDEGPPVAQTLAATGLRGTVVVLHGVVDDGHQKTRYWFEIGATTAYGATTQPVTIDKDAPVAVTSLVSGLLATGTYHARLVARNDDGLSLGADVTFTGAGLIPAASPPSRLPGSATDAGTQQLADADAGTAASVLPPPAQPTLGESVGVEAQAGSVLVRLPGAKRAVTLTDTASIPVGSVVDVRKGTVHLSSALPGDDTQTGTFHGGVFEVRQPAGARGMTELVLRGRMPTCTGAGARAATASARRPPRGLWGRDDHGRFRTRGANSVATVRGTAWYVEDRCDGTLTRVSRGSVSVRDLRRQRTVIVAAGKRYLARSAR